MRLFTTKQLCTGAIKVAGWVSDEHATELDAARESYEKDPDNTNAYDRLEELSKECDLNTPNNDCDEWNDTPEELWKLFTSALDANSRMRNPNMAFRYMRAENVLEYLERHAFVNVLKVQVQKAMYCTGVIRVLSDTEEQAMELVEGKIVKGEIHESSVDWNEPTYEDMSFKTTGDVE